MTFFSGKTLNFSQKYGMLRYGIVDKFEPPTVI
jgi:hypothetical protein